MDNEKVWREYKRHLITLQQNSDGYIDDEEDCHYQSKSNLFPFISTHTASRNDDNHEQPNTYVAGERYNNPHVLSENANSTGNVSTKIAIFEIVLWLGCKI